MTDRELTRSLSRVKSELRRAGVIPFTDSKAPSVVSVVAGSPIAGSWWGHPAGQLIYQVGESLDADGEVLTVRLWKGKLTLVHRRLWPALVRIGTARVEWQVAGLSSSARGLLAAIDRPKSRRGHRRPSDIVAGTRGVHSALRELDRRLLVLTRSVHTSSGTHVLEAESWAKWRARTRTPRFPGSVALAETTVEAAARRLASDIDPRGVFPWHRSKPRALEGRNLRA